MRRGSRDQDFAPEFFELAGIGKLPAETLTSRCITVMMQPPAPGEQIEKFRSDRAIELSRLTWQAAGGVNSQQSS
jgi:hypothetical protein